MKAIAPQVDLFLVVGSANSSNSVRMVEVALVAGAPAAHLVENAEADRPGVARGRRARSGCPPVRPCPTSSCRRRRSGWPSRATATVDEVAHTEERLTFALPRELRRDLGLRETRGAALRAGAPQRRVISRMPAMMSTAAVAAAMAGKPYTR